MPDARPILTPPTLLLAKQSAEDEEQKRRIERAAAKRLRKLTATTGRHQSPPTEKDQSTFAPQTTSIRKRTPSSKTVKSYSEMNLAEFCRRRRSGKIPLMKASCGTFLCAKQLIMMVTEKKTFPKIGMKFEFRGTQFCRNRREEAFERSRPKGKRLVAGHAQKAAFINRRPLETMVK